MKMKVSLIAGMIFLLSGCFDNNVLIGNWELANKEAVNPIREYSFSKKEMINTLGITLVIKYEVNRENIKVFIADSDPIVFMIKDKNKICALTALAILLPEGDNCYVRVER